MCKKIWIEFSGCKTMCALSQHEKQPYSCYFCFSIYGCNVLPFFSLYFLVECWNSIYTKCKQKSPDSELIELIWGCFVLRRKWGLNQYRVLWAVDKLEADLGLGKLCALLCLLQLLLGFSELGQVKGHDLLRLLNLLLVSLDLWLQLGCKKCPKFQKTLVNTNDYWMEPEPVAD